jgi:hypothetical protein
MPITTYPLKEKTEEGPSIWLLAGTYGTIDKRDLDGFEVYILLKGQRYKLNNRELEQYLIKH